MTIESAIGCVPRTPTATAHRLGADAGARSDRGGAFGAEPDIAAWANGCALNPTRIEPWRRERPRGAGRRGTTRRRGRPRAPPIGRTRSRAPNERQ